MKKLIYMSSVRRLDAVRKTCQERWMIETDGERKTEREREGGRECVCVCVWEREREGWGRVSRKFVLSTLLEYDGYDYIYIFLSLRVFGLLSSSLLLLLFPLHFGRYVLWPSSGVCRTQEPTWNFELCPLLNPRGSSVLIPLAITGYKS